MSKKKSNFMINLEYIPFLGLYHLVNLIPLKCAYFLNCNLFKLLYHLDSKHRNRTRQHLLHSGIVKTPEEADKLALQTFVEFGKLLVEIVKFSKCYRADKITSVGDPEGVALAFGEHNQGVIVVTAHYGNWEVAGTAWAEHSRIPMVSIMRPFDNPKIGELILAHRRGDMHQPVDKNGGIRPVLKALREGKNIAILADQHAMKPEGIVVQFFGQPAQTHTSPALLHLKTGIPIVPEVTRRKNDNFEFELVAGKPIRYTPTGNQEEDVKNITQMYTSALEELIRQDPKQWLWAHRRWTNLNR